MKAYYRAFKDAVLNAERMQFTLLFWLFVRCMMSSFLYGYATVCCCRSFLTCSECSKRTIPNNLSKAAAGQGAFISRVLTFWLSWLPLLCCIIYRKKEDKTLFYLEPSVELSDVSLRLKERVRRPRQLKVDVCWNALFGYPCNFLSTTNRMQNQGGTQGLQKSSSSLGSTQQHCNSRNK